MKVVVLGSSVGLIVRPPRRSREEGTYTEVLERMLAERLAPEPVHVVNRCVRGGVASDALARFEEWIVQAFPDVVVLQYGVNECVPRLLSRRMWRLLNWKYERVSEVRRLGAGLVNEGLNVLAKVWLARFPGRRWMYPGRFEKDLLWLVDLIEKEVRARVVLLNIGPPSERVEAALPGSRAGAARYNAILERVARARPEAVSLVDVHALVAADGLERLQPDGIHLSAEGHRLVAEQIVARLAAGRRVEAPNEP